MSRRQLRFNPDGSLLQKTKVIQIGGSLFVKLPPLWREYLEKDGDDQYWIDVDDPGPNIIRFSLRKPQ